MTAAYSVTIVIQTGYWLLVFNVA